MTHETTAGHGKRSADYANERGRPVVQVACNCGWRSPKRATEADADADLETHMRKESKRG
jgi:hypothetical protein